MSVSRKAVVETAFSSLDQHNNGFLALEDLANNYNVESLSRFKSGEKSKKELTSEFLAQWDTVDKDGRVSK